VARVEPVSWPEAPAEPRVHLHDILSSPDGTPRPPSFLSRAWRAIAGIDAEDGAHRFLRPFGVASTARGEVLVADPDAALVVLLAPGAPGRYVTCPDRVWGAPMAVAAAADGRIFVADPGDGIVVRVDPDGRCTDLGAGELERPTGLAERNGRLFVADPPRHHVAVLSTDGRPLGTIGVHGEGDGELNAPTAVALASNGDVLVVDAMNFRIARFSQEGAWLGAFGGPLDDGWPFALPKAIAVGPGDRIYVSDAPLDVVDVFRADGVYDYSIGASGAGPGRFTNPAGVAAAGGTIYVADSFAGRVQAFELLGAHP
jgi:DNA-binding beta-propeller fold protein YncE